MEDEQGMDALPQRDPVEFLYSLLNEAQELRARFEAQWDRNARLYAGDHWETLPPDGLKQFTLNMIKRAIDSICAVMTEQRPRTTLAPRETVAPGIAFIDQLAGAELAAGLAKAGEVIEGIFDPFTPTQSPLVTGQPITDTQAKMLIEAGLLPEESVIVVNDSSIAEACDTVLNGFWDAGKWMWSIAEAIQACLVTGHRDIEIGWDADRQIPTITQYPAKNTWIDPNCTDYDTAQYGIVARVMSVDEAVALYPMHEAAIRANAEQNVTNIENATISGIYNTLYERDMTLMVTGWIRNQPYGVADEQGNPAVDETGQPIRRFGVRKIICIGQTVVADEPAEFGDIQLVRFRNIPLPDRPYALGEPEILEDCNEQLNRQASIFMNHLRYFQTPQVIMSEEVRRLQGADTPYSHPGKVWTVPDHFYQQGGASKPPIEIVQPPPLDGSQLKLFQVMVELFNSMAGQTDVMRGEAPAGVTSGVALEALQREARGTIGLRSMWIEKAVTRMTSICLTMIRDHMTEEGWRRYTDKYSPKVLEAIRNRMKDVELDVVVEMAAGRGETRQTEMQKAQLMRQTGELTRLTYLEKMGIPDPEGEAKGIVKEQIEMMQAQAALAMSGGAEGDTKDSKGVPSGKKNRGSQTAA